MQIIFFGDYHRHAIPIQQLVEISQVSKFINISYRAGEMVEIKPNVYQEKIAAFTLEYAAEELAMFEMTNFYAAVSENKNAYYFGDALNS